MTANNPVDAMELAALLSTTRLSGRPLRDAGASILAMECGADEVWEAWSAARSVVDRSGRWPVVVTNFGELADLSTTAIITNDSYTADLDAAAGSADAWATFVHYAGDQHVDDWSLRLMIEYDPYLTADDGPVLLAAGATLSDVERLKLDRRLAAAGSADRLVADPQLTSREGLWFTPTGEQCAVVFLPVQTSWEAVAGVYYFGAGDISRHAALIAAAQEWGSLYGAELVASWTTMLQFSVTTPPGSLEDAWRLAGQQLAVGGSLQTPRSDLAVALLHADAWFLHDRP